MAMFPRTEVAGISLPRMLIGSNWIAGYSHTSASADQMIKNKYSTKEAVAAQLEAYLEYGIDAMMALFSNPVDDPSDSNVMLDGIHLAEDRTGKKITIIDTPIVDMSDTA